MGDEGPGGAGEGVRRPVTALDETLLATAGAGRDPALTVVLGLRPEQWRETEQQGDQE